MLSPSFRERSIVEFLEFFIAPAVSSHCRTGGVNYPQCLSILHEAMGTWIVICPSSLSLLPEEFLQGVLINVAA